MNVVVGIIITKEFENIFTLVYLFQGLFTVTQNYVYVYTKCQKD